MTAFCIASAIMFFFIFLIWSKSDLLNLFIKMVFGCMMVWAIAETAIQLGFHR